MKLSDGPSLSNGSTYTDAIIPVRNIILVPLKPDMKLLCRGDDLVEITNNGITFRFGDSHNGFDKPRIEEKGFPSSHRVSADDGMFCDDRLSTDRTSKGSRTFSLKLRRMESCQLLEILLHLRRHYVVSCVLRRPERVSAASTWRTRQYLE